MPARDTNPKVDHRFHIGGSAEAWINSGQWLPVRSSNVAEIKYDKLNRRLYVMFKRGGVYFYSGVTPQRAKKFFHTGSFGHEVWELRWAGYTGYQVRRGPRGRYTRRTRR